MTFIMSEKVLAELQVIFREVLAQPSLTLTASTRAEHVRNWDSLNHMRLIAAIEDHYGISMSFEEVRALREVGDLLRLVVYKTSA